MSDFKNFNDIKKYILSRQGTFEKTKEQVKTSIGIYVRDKIKSKHKKGYLLNTGKLRDSVTYKTDNKGVIIYTEMDWLAHIHEYGRRRKATSKQLAYLFANVFKGENKKKGRGDGFIVIPERPIWRIILQTEKNRIESLVDKYLDKYF